MKTMNKEIKCKSEMTIKTKFIQKLKIQKKNITKKNVVVETRVPGGKPP